MAKAQRQVLCHIEKIILFLLPVFSPLICGTGEKVHQIISPTTTSYFEIFSLSLFVTKMQNESCFSDQKQFKQKEYRYFHPD